MKKRYLASLLAFFLSGCLGYQIGPVKPYYLRDVQTLAIPTFKNSTLYPRVEVLVTGTIIKQIQTDGTFRVVGDDRADATLQGEILSISRSPSRSVRGNVLATTEFALGIRVRYRLVDRTGKDLGQNGIAVGSTSFFVSNDVNTDERQALPLATEDLAKRLVSQLSEGW